MKYILHILAILVVFSAVSLTNPKREITKEEFEKLLSGTTEYFKDGNYSYRINYKSYTSHDSKSPVDKFDGIMIRQGKSMYCELPGNHVVQDENMRLLINQDQRELYLLDPDFEFGTDAEWDHYSNQMQNVSRIETEQVNNETRIDLIFKPKNEFESQRIILDEKGLLTMIVLFYPEMDDYDENNGSSKKVKPRAEMIFSNISNSPSLAQNQMLSHYLSKDKKGQGQFAGYKVLDYRLNKKN